ncbi:CwfJ C-terminus 1-domain-containing protein-like protein [Pilobolus umbonatus]|nr:CwfJ C-terminus 1-domain-containing protein-like protein [Pilobolus umbonatus]
MGKKSKKIDYSDSSLWVEAEEPEIVKEKSKESRHGWMLDGNMDFGSMGREKEKKEDKPHPDEIKISHRELNQYLVQGVKVEDYPVEKPKIKYGDAGSSWRMMKLKRTREQAEDEGRSVEEVALERYGSMEKYQEALDERAYLDSSRYGDTDRRGDRDRRRYDDNVRGGRKDRHNDNNRRRDDKRRDGDDRRGDHDDRRKNRREEGVNDRRGDNESSGQRRYVFTNTQAQSNFKRPDRPKRKRSPSPPISTSTPTPISIIHTSTPQPRISRDELNKLNAKVVKAKMLGSDKLEALEKEYEEALHAFENQSNEVEVLPTLDNQGRLYDYALSNKEELVVKGKKKYEGTHDKITGERLKYGTADDNVSLMDMVRQERGGRVDMDMEFANRIVADASYQNNLDYMDEKADIMATKKGQTEEQKMKRAISDYKRTQDSLSKCRLCYQEGQPPQITLISLATTCYLALPNTLELTPGSCLIVPLQHVSSSLECDDDVWTEIRNFQKCLMKMFHAQGKGVVFMETVVQIRSQRHTAIEVIPIPYGVYEDAPMYFKEAILMSEEEWSQHKKLIDTSDRGFRYSMVKNLPYFHVWFGLDKGYGHVIENSKDFPYWFGKEVIAGMLDIGPELWRKPRYHHSSEQPQRQAEFLKEWEKWDWTSAL